MHEELDLDLNWKKISAIILLVIGSFFAGLIVHTLYYADFQIAERERIEKEILTEQLHNEKVKIESEKKDQEKKQALFTDYGAKSILIKELGGEEIFTKNKDLILPIASLTKVVNAIVALETKSEEAEVIMTLKSLRVEGNYGLHAYENFKLYDAVRYMLIGSVNDIASSISFGYVNLSHNWDVFLKKMNQFAQDQEMQSTLFFSENGLDITPHIMGSYSTSDNIATAVEYFYKHYPKLSQETVKVEDDICSSEYCHYVKNTNLILETHPEIKFSKTGYTKRSGGSVAVVVELKGKEYVIVVLNSTKQGRFDDLEKSIADLKEYLK